MKFLIATDGSGTSESVIKAACETIGKPENTTVKIISAIETPTPLAAEPFAVSAEYYQDFLADLSKQAKNTIEAAEANLKELCPNIGGVSGEVVRGGAAQAIVETASEWGADLIVIGSHGYGFWSRALLGSVSNSVVHHAPCSVLIVRGKTTEKS